MSNNMTSRTTICLDVTPLDALVDEPVTIRLSGLPAGQRVTLWACAQDIGGNSWISSASFIAESNGEIDVAKQLPVAGSYHQANPMGLLWSMQPVGRKASFFLAREHMLAEIDLIAEIDGTAVAATRLKRHFAGEDVVKVPVRERGLVGVFSYPVHSESLPAVIILSGSDGRICENEAALLASHGFATLALAYFGAEGLPKNLAHIPLEYFEGAFHWLQEQPAVQGNKIGVVGLSRGGELALLLGATFPAIKVVVACSPSGLIQAGIDGNNYSRSAWTYHGQPLQQVVVKFTPLLALKLMWQSIRAQSFPMRDMFYTTLKDHKHLAEATIPVENTQGP
ncbi:MAG TPA: acyl-CoA thioesterase/BAAT N-terminal domain-containing protein, partial [Ktedonobacteraceae bacterium]